MLLVCIFVAVEGVMPELRVPLIADIGVELIGSKHISRSVARSLD
ncbi:hypothetical protein [Porphyromonas gingivalis]|nr:hypothetical protein [Porphyromonas gingivalis]OWR78837.1 hypothetical protein SJDPG11_00820 [Porphyromonas gingivalis SJD11]